MRLRPQYDSSEIADDSWASWLYQSPVPDLSLFKHCVSKSADVLSLFSDVLTIFLNKPFFKFILNKFINQQRIQSTTAFYMLNATLFVEEKMVLKNGMLI